MMVEVSLDAGRNQARGVESLVLDAYHLSSGLVDIPRGRERRCVSSTLRSFLFEKSLMGLSCHRNPNCSLGFGHAGHSCSYGEWPAARTLQRLVAGFGTSPVVPKPATIKTSQLLAWITRNVTDYQGEIIAGLSSSLAREARHELQLLNVETRLWHDAHVSQSDFTWQDNSDENRSRTLAGIPQHAFAQWYIMPDSRYALDGARSDATPERLLRFLLICTSLCSLTAARVLCFLPPRSRRFLAT